MSITDQVLLEAIVQELQGLRRDMRGHRSNKHVMSGKDKKALYTLWKKRQDLLTYSEQSFVENIFGKDTITPRQYFWLSDLCEDYGVSL